MLAGSAGTFGFARASTLARELELHLEGEGPLDPAALPGLAELSAALAHELQGEPGGTPVSSESDQRSAPAGADPPLLLVAGEQALGEQLSTELSARGVTAVRLPTLAAALDAVRTSRADLLVLDLGAPEGVGEALDLLAEASLRLPVAVLTDAALLVDRVEVARRGGRAFLPRSAPVSDLVDAILALRGRLSRRDATILAVDDDPAVLDALEAVLGAAGMRVER